MMGELGPLTTGEVLAAERTKFLALVGELQNAPDSIERCKNRSSARSLDGASAAASTSLLRATFVSPPKTRNFRCAR